MKLHPISTNCSELVYDNGNRVLFSYQTAVAVSVNPIATPTGKYVGTYKTNVKSSNTTTKHLNAWTSTEQTLPQRELEELVRLAAGN